MLRNVLIAEDHECANISVQKTLRDLGIENTDYVYYCDDALKRITKSQEAEPYDLLITDLYFDEDENPQIIKGGMELIEEARKIQPRLKVLVFSAENKAGIVEKLYNELNVDGYVCKGRRDAQELRIALDTITKNRRHFPVQLRQAIKQKNTYDFSDFDITIISLLSNGMLQKDIPAYLQQNQIRPSGLSSVEKRLNRMKEVLEFTKNEQLVAFCKDNGII